MSPDEPFAPEPVRGLSPMGTSLLIGLIAFLAGAALTAAIAQYYGGGLWRAPVPAAPVQTPQPGPSPAAALSPGIDVATLAAREQALAARLEQLDLKLRDIEGGARAASSYASQAERLMIAVAVRRNVERGLALGPLELQLRQRFGETHGEAVSTIVNAAGQPVTLEDLRLALDTIGPRLRAAPGEGWWSGVQRLFGDLVVLRQSDLPSPRPADRLKRAQRMLDEGQVEGALAEVTHMPGVNNAESWVSAAKRYVAARAALREIELAAMDTPAAPRAAAGT